MRFYLEEISLAYRWLWHLGQVGCPGNEVCHWQLHMMHSNVAVLLGIGDGGAVGLFLGASQGSLC